MEGKGRGDKGRRGRAERTRVRDGQKGSSGENRARQKLPLLGRDGKESQLWLLL